MSPSSAVAAGHVGLPLGIALATVPDIRASLLDINEDKVTLVNSGHMPFMEKGADLALTRIERLRDSDIGNRRWYTC